MLRNNYFLFSLFPTGRVYVLRQPKEAFHPDCLQSTVKNGGGSVMIWGAISWKSARSIIFFMKEFKKETIYKFEVTKFTLWLKHCFQRKTSIFKMIKPQSMQLELLKNDMRNIVMKLSILYDQHNLQTSILLSIYGQF